MVKAKKHLGQHFLKNEEVTLRIADALSQKQPYNNVLEIGPGTGVLTKYLVEKDYNLKVVEIDRESIAYLQEHYPSLEIIEQDFLRMDLSSFYNQAPIAIIGNFPYYISSQILFKIYDNKDQVLEMVGMFQKEVAERVCAKPGSKTYGVLSVLIQAFYDVEYLFTVNENDFDPPPKVKSGVMRMERNTTKHLSCDEKLFKQIVKLGFNQRRKTLRNSLKSILPEEARSNDIFGKRPEQLSVEDFIGICTLVETARNN